MSLDNRPALAEPVTSVAALADFFRGGEKAAGEVRVGMEHEKIGLLAGTRAPIPFAGPRGIEELLRRLPRPPWQLFFERGAPIAALEGARSVSLEPGGQLELSGLPCPRGSDLARELRRHLAVVRALSAELGHVWLGAGYRPFGTAGDAEWVPKGRYERMRDSLGRRGPLALDMMTMTATVQASFDYLDEADMGEKLRGATAVSPIVTALYANSPLVDGKPSGFLSFRAHVWGQCDAARCGPLAAAFRPGFGYRAYAEWALDVPMLFLRRGERYLDARGFTFRRFLAEGLAGERATFSDWEDHLTALFPEVRLKRVIEVRGADAGSEAMCAALPALWKGLFYDRDALAAAALLLDLPLLERLALEEDVARRALAARAGKRLVRDLARELLDLSAAGLRRQPGGAEDARLLEPLREIAAEGLCPAERALQRLDEGGGDPSVLVEHWRIA